jgi:hypothetical protein
MNYMWEAAAWVVLPLLIVAIFLFFGTAFALGYWVGSQ